MSVQESTKIFSLDIGTRSVIGIMASKENKQYKVLDYISQEHQKRSMIDGQIHDIVAVAEVITEVKSRLEAKHGSLEKVAVAAAGRSLKTKRTKVERHLADRPYITREDILAMELEAIQQAQAELAQENGQEQQTTFYCVGYSVMRYFLDGEEIGNLQEQRGKQAGVEIIATFLPQVVIDSLLAALQQADLEMGALTLEPIAAINTLIPPTMRRLNIALVDIGAGTSDIALTAEGTITAYGMVPIAGDEITDALCQHFLLDFPIAEEIKRKLLTEEQIHFTDILGFEQTLSSEEIIKAIQPATQQLAEKICREIMHLNGKSPQAVMLIGGGALTPQLTQWISELLGLPANRVAVRGLEANDLLSFDPQLEDQYLHGPEAVTPIGIAVVAEEFPVNYVHVTVNEETIRLFDLQRLTIGDALLASSLSITKIHGKPGLALGVEINGDLKLFPGTHGYPPSITCNGQVVSLDTALKPNDQINVLQGRDGQDAEVNVQDILEGMPSQRFIINQKEYQLPPLVTVNGQPAETDQQLHDRDQVQITYPDTIGRGLEALALDVQQLLASRSVQVRFNDQVLTLTHHSYSIFKNDQPSSVDDALAPGDHIDIRLAEAEHFRFSDAFRYVTIDLTSIPKGKNMVLRVNGAAATFETPIEDGDILELKWE